MESPYNRLKFSKAQRKRRGFYYICESCGIEFYVNPARIRDAEKHSIRIRFCSKVCYSKGEIGDGNPFWGKKHTPDSIAKMLANPNRRSFEPTTDKIAKLPMHRLSRAKNNIPNPNIVKFGLTPSRGSTVKRWRRYLLAKRGARCERCGYSSYDGIIEIHHIDCNRKNQVEENMQLLCPTCHAEIHWLEGTGKYGKHGDGTTHSVPNPQTVNIVMPLSFRQ